MANGELIRAKIGVSAVKIKNYLFSLFIFNYFKITDALKLESVRSQEKLHEARRLSGFVRKTPNLRLTNNKISFLLNSIVL